MIGRRASVDMDGARVVGTVADYNATDKMYLVRFSEDEGDVGWFWADDVKLLPEDDDA